MKTTLLIEFVLIGVTPLVILGLKKWFNVSIRFLLSATFALFILLSYSTFYITNQLNASLVIPGLLVVVSASVAIIAWLFKQVVIPVEKTISTIDDFAYNELGSDIHNVDNSNEIKQLNSSVETLTNWTKMLLSDIEVNNNQINKMKSQQNSAYKLNNILRMSSVLNKEIINYDLSFYFDIKPEEFFHRNADSNIISRKSEVSDSKKRIMYKSFSIN